MSNAGAFSSGAGLVDDILGEAYLVIKNVSDNMVAITDLGTRSEAIDQIKAELDLAENSTLTRTLAVIMAGSTNFRGTFAEALVDFVVGEYFTSNELGDLRVYKRTAGLPGYTDQGITITPVSSAELAATTGAALIGTSEDDINVEEALVARPKSTLLASVSGAALIGTVVEGVNVQEALDALPTAVELAAAVADKAHSGANSDITSLSGLTTPLSVEQGGTGGNDPAEARAAIGAGVGSVIRVDGVGTVNGITLTGSVTGDGDLELGGSVTSVDPTATIGGVKIGYRSIPRSTTNTLTTIGDIGKCIALTAGITIPSATFAGGDAYSFYNDSAAAVTLTQGAGLTLRFAGTTTTGNRTLAARGLATIWFNSPTEAVISGPGIS